MDPVGLWWSLAVLAAGSLLSGLLLIAIRAYEGTKP
jgi:hypothetical protein